jgi:hypothetical protein
VWQPCVQTGRPAAEASAAIRSASVIPPQRDRSGWTTDTAPASISRWNSYLV